MTGGGRGNRDRAATYAAWHSMKRRCESEACDQWKNYGGRGITVCERWSNSFAAFLDDMGIRPAGTSIDRINNDGPYSPENCRWATRAEQARNRRNSVLIEHGGERLCVRDWAERLGINERTLAGRLRRGWPTHEAVTTPGNMIARRWSRHGTCLNGHSRDEHSYIDYEGKPICRRCRDERVAAKKRAA